ncbi:MAG: aspartate aminotransferase, partial [bacterium]|nr:aspartate aminotransferase [bacterium]
ARLANAHENILAVKLDGPTKEDYVWGFRVGFMTFGIKNNSEELYAALESKLAGAIRGTISNASHTGQSLLLNAYSSDSYEGEKQECFTTLKTRYSKVQEILSSHKEYQEIFTALPFNSGYFMCIKIIDSLEAEKMRQHLIAQYNTGVIATGNLLRIAFSSTPSKHLETL